MNQSHESLMAQATAAAMIRTAQADSIDLPQRIAAAVAQMAAETGQRVLKISAGQTPTRYLPDGPLPDGVRQYEWSQARLLGRLPSLPTWPNVRVVEPRPCYLLHVSGNGITAESWFKSAGFEADSSAPYRCTVLEIGR